MVAIYSVNGLKRYEVPVNIGSKRICKLMGDDFVRLVFSLAEPIHLRIGDYCKIPGFGRFEMVDTYKPKYNKVTGGYDYEPEFWASYWKFKNKIFKYAPKTGGSEASWTLTATLDVHLDIFLSNLEALGYDYDGTPYVFSIDATVTRSAKALTYNNTDMISALGMMADAWGCEWWFVDNVINFGKCERGEPVDFVNGSNVAFMSNSDNRQLYATRVYAFGSTRNIPKNYRPVESSFTVNGITQKRLMLPTDTPYVDADENQSSEESVEHVVVFEDVYPRTNGKISEVTSYESKGTDADGNEITETFYRFKDSSITFFKEYILPDTELYIVFKSGKLNGMQFDVAFNPLGVAERTPDGMPNPEAQMWEIVASENYGRKLPDTILKPETGDEYILCGWDTTRLTDLGLVAAAENELLEKTKEYVKKTRIDNNCYQCVMMSDWMKKQGDTSEGYRLPFGIGDRINLVNPAYFEEGSRQSRVIGYECPLDIPYDSPEFTIGESPIVSRLRALEDTVESLTVMGQTYGSVGNGGSGVYIIGTGSTATPTNRNVYSALRSLRQFLSKVSPDTASALITFAEGLVSDKLSINRGGTHFGDFVSGLMTGRGGAVDPLGNAEVESITVRSYMKVAELIINRISASEGDQMFTDADTVESMVDNGDGTYGLYLRRERENDFTSLTQGAVVKGMVNTLGDGGRDYYTSWMRVNSVNTAANYIEVSLYPDDEVPAGRNFPPCGLMRVARWGHQTDESRQSLFYISSTEGCMVKLEGVTKPILERGNYKAVFGRMPGFIRDLCPELAGVAGEIDGLLAERVFATQFVQIDRWGLPIPTCVDRGVWSAEVADTEAGGEGYFGGGYNPLTGNYEISDAYHLGCKWRCCKDGTKAPPRWDTTDWAFLEGNPDFTVEFAPVCTTSTVEGLDITLTVTGRLHNQDVTDDIRDSDVEWTRYSEDSRGNPRPLSDNAWAISHAGAGKSVRITRADIDYDGTIPRVVRFTATATLRDGMTTASARMDMAQI